MGTLRSVHLELVFATAEDAAGFRARERTVRDLLDRLERGLTAEERTRSFPVALDGARLVADWWRLDTGHFLALSRYAIFLFEHARGVASWGGVVFWEDLAPDELALLDCRELGEEIPAARSARIDAMVERFLRRASASG